MPAYDPIERLPGRLCSIVSFTSGPINPAKGFKLGYASIVSHCLFGKVCGEGFTSPNSTPPGNGSGPLWPNEACTDLRRSCPPISATWRPGKAARVVPQGP